MNIFEQFDISGKMAIVTGCNKGIGKAMAAALAEAGADIIGVSRGNDYEEVENAVKATGRKFKYYQVDIADREQVYSFINQVKGDDIRIDILVNNAGTVLRKPVAEYPDEYWDKIISINLNAQFILAREFGKLMLERAGGKIVFTCSLLSFQGGINVPAYTASKSAVAGLVKAFANEWAAKGVCVNGIAPGYIITNNTQALLEDPERSKAILARIPAGRWGKPADLRGAVVFLCSPASDYVNGTILTVDGGWMAR